MCVKFSIYLLLLFCLSVRARADDFNYIDAKIAVREAFGENRDNAAALQAYLALAENKHISDHQRTDALSAAVQYALQLDDTDIAAETAGRIPLAGFRELEHMRVMSKQRQWADLLSLFGGTDFEVFPIIVRGDCYQVRAESLDRMGRREAALADYRLALRYTRDRRMRGKLEAKLESMSVE